MITEDIEAQIGDVRIPKYPTNDGDTSSDDSSDDDNTPYESPAAQQEKYRRKYIKLKRRIKDLVFENAALCDESFDQQTLVAKYQKDRLQLLKRLTKYEKEFEKIYREAKQESRGKQKTSTKAGSNGNASSVPAVNDTAPQSNGQSAAPQKRKYRKRQPVDPTAPPPDPTVVSTPKKRGRKPGFKLNKNKDTTSSTTVTPSQTTPSQNASSSFQQQLQIIRPTPVQNKIEIEVDAYGNPVCPFTVDGFTVFSLGHIIFQKSAYHTNEYIYPVGYHICRVYGHFKHPERKCSYYCKVLENGEFPKFEITAHESEGKCRITGPSPDYCHTTLLQFINNANTARSVDIRPQGESFFGLSNPTIASLIQRLPNADKCRHFAPRIPKLAVLNTSGDASLNFEALQRSIRLPAYHNIPEVKEEPPEDLFEI